MFEVVFVISIAGYASSSVKSSELIWSAGDTVCIRVAILAIIRACIVIDKVGGSNNINDAFALKVAMPTFERTAVEVDGICSCSIGAYIVTGVQDRIIVGHFVIAGICEHSKTVYILAIAARAIGEGETLVGGKF